MQELWSSASYEPHLLSLPFAFAPAAMAVVIAYAIVMRGESVLRGWILLHFVSLMPYSVAVMMSPSVTSEAAANALFRLAAAFIPMAAAAGAGFQLRLVGKQREWRWFVVLAMVAAVGWVIAGAFTGAAIAGVYRLPAGLWFASAGPYAWLALVMTVLIATPGFTILGLAALRPNRSGSSAHAYSADERRQLRLALAANLITYAGLADVALAYHLKFFPVGWLLSGAGSVLVARALVVENLLRVRAVDTTAPIVILHFASGALLGWLALGLLGADAPWWARAATLALSFAGVRVAIAVLALVGGARSGDGTLDRLLGELVARGRAARSEPEVAQLAIDIVELGVGTRVVPLLAAAEDWGWTTAGGARLDDAAAPDPLLGAWIAEQRGALFVDELELRVPEDLRDVLRSLFERHAARTIIPVGSDDALLALVLVPANLKRLRGASLAFVERACERFAEALVHVRMARSAAERATLAREVELAATVQAQLLPGPAPRRFGELEVVGSWQPATKCAGDFWGVYPLGGGRLLVAIGDVTGHGVASATVTAAAAAACDVAVRRRGEALALDDLITALDAAVRRVGGGQLAMTIFCAILDPAAGELRFVSCGHPTPYVCRAGANGPELNALVGRGNPLGAGATSALKVVTRAFTAGDLLVCYTDGVTEAQDPGGVELGDRKLQRLLRRLEQSHLSPQALHDVIAAAVAAHRGGRPRDDDETLVIAQWLAPAKHVALGVTP